MWPFLRHYNDVIKLIVNWQSSVSLVPAVYLSFLLASGILHKPGCSNLYQQALHTHLTVVSLLVRKAPTHLLASRYLPPMIDLVNKLGQFLCRTSTCCACPFPSSRPHVTHFSVLHIF